MPRSNFYEVMPKEEDLSEWLDAKLNVLFEGRHGTGKTSIVKDAFSKKFTYEDENGVTHPGRINHEWLYFSASTLDPWVDLVGVPKEKTMKVDGVEISYLDLVRPKALMLGNVRGIMFDELNRCLAGDTKIQLVSGTSVCIKDLVGEKEFFVYSYDTENKCLAVGRGHSARKTGEKRKILKITLDNGLSIKCTPDHPFLLTENIYVNAEDLKENDKLMALYKKYNKNGYELISSFRPTRWEYTYHLSDKYNIKKVVYPEIEGNQRHHIDKNRFNNNPDNIERLSRGDHIKKHASDGGIAAHFNNPDLVYRTILTNESMIKSHTNSSKTRNSSEKFKKIRSGISKNMYTKEMISYRSEITKKQWDSGQFDDIDRHDSARKAKITYTIKRLEEENIDFPEHKEEYEVVRFRLQIKDKEFGKKSLLKLSTIIKWFGNYDNFREHVWSHKNKDIKNHRIISIEECGAEDVYDITVDDYHNFAIGQGVFVHNSHKKVRNSVMELLQFQSINGHVFPNLEIVWAAINPSDDDDLEFDVDPLDPAQEDRFEIHVTIPYQPSESFFTKKYGAETSKAAISWWSKLPDNIKLEVTPRRLEYAIDCVRKNINLRYILPEKALPKKLYHLLRSGLPEDAIRNFMKNNDTDAARKWLANENNFDAIKRIIVKEDECMSFCLPLLDGERVISIIADERDVRNEVFSNPHIYIEILKDIANGSQNNTLKKNAVAMLASIGGEDGPVPIDKIKLVTKPIPRTITKKHIEFLQNSFYIRSDEYPVFEGEEFKGMFEKEFRKLVQFCHSSATNTFYRREICDKLKSIATKKDMNREESIACLKIVDFYMSHSNRRTVFSNSVIHLLINRCIQSLIDNDPTIDSKDLFDIIPNVFYIYYGPTSLHIDNYETVIKDFIIQKIEGIEAPSTPDNVSVKEVEI